MQFLPKLKPFFKPICIVLFFSMLFNPAFSQADSEASSKVYQFNFATEIPLTAGMFLGASLGFEKLTDKPTLSQSTLNSLSMKDVWFFDRIALKQNPANREIAHKISNWGLYTTAVLPGLLAFDNQIRKEWLPLLFIYLEAQASTNIAYAWGPTQWVKRIRPMAYYNEVPLEERLGTGTTDSFLSGHVANTATASFFMAKVYSDFHPELGAKKWLLYGAAFLPPTFVAVMRFKALKHFPTDLMLGMAAGAVIGVLIPHWHKVKAQSNLSVMPMAGAVNGLRLSYQFTYK